MLSAEDIISSGIPCLVSNAPFPDNFKLYLDEPFLSLGDDFIPDRVINALYSFPNLEPEIEQSFFISKNGKIVTYPTSSKVFLTINRHKFDYNKNLWVDEISDGMEKNLITLENTNKYHKNSNQSAGAFSETTELVDIADIKSFQYGVFTNLVNEKILMFEQESEGFDSPVNIFKDADGLHLINGNHRVNALIKMGRTKVLAIVKEEAEG